MIIIIFVLYQFPSIYVQMKEYYFTQLFNDGKALWMTFFNIDTTKLAFRGY